MQDRVLLNSFGIASILAVVGLTGFADEPVAPTRSPVIGRTVENFKLPDHHGRDRSLAEYRDADVVVLVFLGVECPLARLYAASLPSSLKKFDQAKVALIGIDANQQDSLAEIAHFVRTNELPYPLLRDGGNRLADRLGAERTPEAFVLDRERRVRYHGRIDDRATYGRQRPTAEHSYVADAVSDLVAGREVAVPHVPAVGCHIGRELTVQTPADGEVVTFSRHIAKIFNARCVECHRPGEIAPFSLTSYSEAVGWAAMIRETTQERRMPPWHADPKHGVFANDAALSEQERALIAQWVDAGAPEGEPAELPPAPTFAEGWRIGQPDVVIPMATTAFSVPAQGEVRYQYFTVDPGFKEDKWIQRAECRPGNREVVHHIIVGIAPPGDRPVIPGEPHSEFLTATAPGARPMILPEGLAKLVPAGSKLVFQMHYTPNGKAQQDLSSVAFVFADPATVKKQVGTDKATNPRFAIPPHAADHPVTGVHRFERDMLLLAMFPHMHLRGKSFRYTAHYPDGAREILLDVPAYDFNWQNSYELAKPKRMPRGTRLVCEATFDNSKANLANPDPSATVRWGDQTWEEMMIGYFDATPADQDLSKKPTRRTEDFAQLVAGGGAKLDDDLRGLAAKSLESDEALLKFGLALRKKLPQLDRICWTTVEDGRLLVVRLAEDQAVAAPLGEPKRRVDARMSAIARGIPNEKPKQIPRLANERGLDYRFMAQAYGSVVHLPARHNGKPATLNFWSQEQDAFSEDAVALLGETVKAMLAAGALKP